MLHWNDAVHTLPLLRTASQVDPLQKNPPRQCVFDEQLVRHAAPLHWYGLHDVVITAGHDPEPAQLAGWVSTPALQLWARHDVPPPG